MLAILIAIPAAVVAASSYFCRRFVRRGGSAKKATFAHIAAALLAGILVCSLALAVSAEGDAPAAADAAAEAGAAGGFAAGRAYLAAALVTGLSGIGGGIAVAAGAPAAIGAYISKNSSEKGRKTYMIVYDIRCRKFLVLLLGWGSFYFRR